MRKRIVNQAKRDRRAAYELTGLPMNGPGRLPIRRAGGAPNERKLMAYAEKTTVSPEKSRTEIEKILVRYGATDFGYMYKEGGGASVIFQVHKSTVRFIIPFPPLDDFRLDKRGWARTDKSQKDFQLQEIRRRWRALALAIKAKLEAVESGITTFEREFLAQILLPNGKDAGEILIPQLEKAAESGQMPRLLLSSSFE